MSLKFGKIFEQMYDSSISRNWKAMVTFQQLIVLAKYGGIVDITSDSIAARTRIPLEIIEEGLSELQKPDATSRSKVEGGRRIIPLLDEDGLPRPWGWRIVNYEKYIKTVSEENRREYNAQKQREYRAKNNSQT